MSPPPLAEHYLFLYNTFQFFGWTIAFSRILWTTLFTASWSIHGAYASAGDLICFLQTLAFLEVLHAAFGLVPSGITIALMQWGGRIHFLLAVVRRISEVQELPSVFITFVAWSLSEIIRYSYYALSGIGRCPTWLTYLRYTAFICLYPIGIYMGEMWLMYQALPFIKEKNLYSNFFHKISLSYHSFVVMLLVSYPFLWLKLYLHLFKQRSSKLGKLPRRKRM